MSANQPSLMSHRAQQEPVFGSIPFQTRVAQTKQLVFGRLSCKQRANCCCFTDILRVLDDSLLQKNIKILTNAYRKKHPNLLGICSTHSFHTTSGMMQLICGAFSLNDNTLRRRQFKWIRGRQWSRKRTTTSQVSPRNYNEASHGADC